MDDNKDDDDDNRMVYSEDPVEARLREITEFLILDCKNRREYQKGEKRQVSFVVANFFEEHLQSVQKRSEKQAFLVEISPS